MGEDDPREGPGEGLERLERALGHRFRDRRLLVTALTHRSHAHEQPSTPAPHYERLEFLGDALLGFLVSERLYRDDPEAPEGTLTRRRQAVVRAETLATAAQGLGLGEAIRLGRGEERTGGRGKPSLLADAFESVLAAVYLDGGVRAARAFVRRHLGGSMAGAAAPGDAGDDHGDDYKTRLQERLQARLQRTPRYRIVNSSGPPHAREFKVEVFVGGCILGSGRGTSRKQAEQRAARQALEADDDPAAGRPHRGSHP